jgi:hypothetical protein
MEGFQNFISAIIADPFAGSSFILIAILVFCAIFLLTFVLRWNGKDDEERAKSLVPQEFRREMNAQHMARYRKWTGRDDFHGPRVPELEDGHLRTEYPIFHKGFILDSLNLFPETFSKVIEYYRKADEIKADVNAKRRAQGLREFWRPKLSIPSQPVASGTSQPGPSGTSQSVRNGPRQPVFAPKITPDELFARLDAVEAGKGVPDDPNSLEKWKTPEHVDLPMSWDPWAEGQTNIAPQPPQLDQKALKRSNAVRDRSRGKWQRSKANSAANLLGNIQEEPVAEDEELQEPPQLLSRPEEIEKPNNEPRFYSYLGHPFQLDQTTMASGAPTNAEPGPSGRREVAERASSSHEVVTMPSQEPVWAEEEVTENHSLLMPLLQDDHGPVSPGNMPSVRTPLFSPRISSMYLEYDSELETTQ